MNIRPPEKQQTLLNFALTTYAKPGVESVCLELQDRYGGQVNVLLWTAWLDSLGAPLNSRLLGQACASIVHQERYCLRPLRRLRRRMPHSYLKLRRWVKNLELRAEYWQLNRLEGYTTLTDSRVTRPEVKSGGYSLKYLCGLGVPVIFRDRVLALL